MRIQVALFVVCYAALGMAFEADRNRTKCRNTVENPCVCTTDAIGGRNYTIDISFLQGKTASQSGESYTYDMYPCEMQKCKLEGGDEKYAVCQVLPSGISFGCGKSDVQHTTWEITDLANKIFTIKFKGGRDGRESDFTFTYGSGETTYKVTSSKQKHYIFEVIGKDVDIRPVGGGSKGLGAGWIVMAALYVMVCSFML